MGGGRSMDFSRPVHPPAGIYGCRKQCLYAIVLFILVVVIMNLALTVWILRVLNFNISGLNVGTVTLSSSGLTVGGRTEVVRTLHASKITSASGTNKRLNITSRGDIVLKSRTGDTGKSVKFHLGSGRVKVLCDEFEVRDLDNQTRFKVTDKAVTYGVDEVTYSGKAVFNGSIETPNIRGPNKGSLRLESVSSSIQVSGRQGVQVEALVGNVEINTGNDLLLRADRKILMNATNILLPGLFPSTGNKSDVTRDDVYQLCMCTSGQLFLAPPTGRCQTDMIDCS
ncbi:zeta-sarcoglycan-like [Mya arenaria]|uniref:zeta-sarcoglycan-like n=1 Tax=Mya arenaria TaxID=6604 RepID=UPI0022E8EC77|nr:zeta-sarcoglycan-like [Mya arenaria]